MRDMFSRSSLMLILTGLVAIAFGIVAMVNPVSTAISLVILWGSFALVDGVVAIIGVFQKGITGGMRIFLVVVGLLGIVAGLIAITRPITSAVTLTWILGIWLVVRGVVEVIDAFARQGSGRWWLVLSAVLWIVAGLLFMANPGAAALTVTFWVGLLALGWGIFCVAAGVMARRRARELPETEVPAGQGV